MKDDTHHLRQEHPGILRLNNARVALLDIETGFWDLRQQLDALTGKRIANSVLHQAGANGGAAFARSFSPSILKKEARVMSDPRSKALEYAHQNQETFLENLKNLVSI
ncbi:MAG: hypothetical protein HGA86_07385, partial [Anaerolineaceae bacterium]|nr:hypothetical protein [Anaerolineaceae bacterium]